MNDSRFSGKVKITLFLILLMLVEMTAPFKIFAQNEPIIQSDSAILMDSKTGAILYEKNIHKKQFPASITKIMTALLAIENGNFDDTLTFSENAVYSIEWGSSHIGMREGEQITLNDALYGMLLMSANEISNGIAEHIDGSVEKFSKHMNNKAKELGAVNTNFVNPHGLHDINHYTTAYDMALITQEALKYDKFKEVLGTTTYIIPPTNLVEEERYLAHQHRLYNEKAYPNSHYKGCEGGKTGFTNEAKHTLVTYAKKNDLELITVVLKSEKQEMYEDTKSLLDYGFNHFERVTLIEKGASAGTVLLPSNSNLESQYENSIKVYTESDLETVIPQGSSEDIAYEISLFDDLSLPILKGDAIGTLNYSYNNKLIGQVKIVSGETLKEDNKNTQKVSSNKVKKELSLLRDIDNSFIRIVIMLILSIVIFGLLYLLLYFINHYRKRKQIKYLIRNYQKR